MAAMREDETLQPVAGVLGYLIPGAGYVWLGESRRGGLVALGVLWLVVGGMLIGGVDVVDREEDKWWFVLQAGAGPVVWGVDRYHQGVKGATPAVVTRSIGRVNEVGSLFVAMGGMINAIAVIDCLWSSPRRGRRGSGSLA